MDTIATLCPHFHRPHRIRFYRGDLDDLETTRASVIDRFMNLPVRPNLVRGLVVKPTEGLFIINCFDKHAKRVSQTVNVYASAYDESVVLPLYFAPNTMIDEWFEYQTGAPTFASIIERETFNQWLRSVSRKHRTVDAFPSWKLVMPTPIEDFIDVLSGITRKALEHPNHITICAEQDAK